MKLLHRIRSQNGLATQHTSVNSEGRKTAFGRTVRACVVVCAGILSVASLSTLSGCIIIARGEACAWDSMHTETRTTSIPVTPEGKVDAKTSNGSVTVSSGDAPNATITATIRARTEERLQQVVVVSSQGADGTLQVRVEWPGGKRHSDEGCSLSITTPKPGAVKVETANGAITVRDIGDSDADLDTSNGRITIEKSAGKVKAHTSNGAVLIDGVREARVSTSNGRISVKLRNDAPGPVDLETSNGAIELTVGTGFIGTLDAKTSNGSINSTFHSGVQATASSKNKASWRFGDATTPTSNLKTSNGRIEVIQSSGK